jgi:hypothetical protein
MARASVGAQLKAGMTTLTLTDEYSGEVMHHISFPFVRKPHRRKKVPEFQNEH